MFTDSNGGRDFTFPVAYTEDSIKSVATMFYANKPVPIGIKNTLARTGGRIGVNESTSNIKICGWFIGY